MDIPSRISSSHRSIRPLTGIASSFLRSLVEPNLCACGSLAKYFGHERSRKRELQSTAADRVGMAGIWRYKKRLIASFNGTQVNIRTIGPRVGQLALSIGRHRTHKGRSFPSAKL